MNHLIKKLNCSNPVYIWINLVAVQFIPYNSIFYTPLSTTNRLNLTNFFALSCEISNTIATTNNIKFIHLIFFLKNTVYIHIHYIAMFIGLFLWMDKNRTCSKQSTAFFLVEMWARIMPSNKTIWNPYNGVQTTDIQARPASHAHLNKITIFRHHWRVVPLW